MLLPLMSIRSALLRCTSGSRLSTAVLIAFAILISGCIESGGAGGGSSSGEPSSPEDYVYKGRVDPLYRYRAVIELTRYKNVLCRFRVVNKKLAGCLYLGRVSGMNRVRTGSS